MSPVQPVRRATQWVRDRATVLAKFGVVGALGVVVNLGVFNALRVGPLGVDDAVGRARLDVIVAAVAVLHGG